MAEVGIISLALQLYVSCIHGYKAFLVAKDRKSNSSVLTTKLQIEEVRLESWGTFWGFTEGKLHGDLTQDAKMLETILKTLKQIQNIIEDTTSLLNKYGLKEEPDSLQLDQVRTPSLAPAKRRGMTALLAISSTIKQSCSWVILDREKFEGLIKDMKDFNDGLYSITLPAQERRSLTKAVVCMLTAGAHSTSRLEDIRTASGEISGTTGIEPYQTLQAVTAFRLRSNAPAEATHRIAKESVTLSNPASQMAAKYSEPSIGQYDGRPVLVEWRSISHNAGSGPRIARLASLLALSPKPADFRVLDLAGYYEDTSSYRLCFVSHLPPSLTTTSLPPINLYNLIVRSGKLSIPPLGDRFRLARALSTSLLQLHAAGWLHRRIRSHTVFFFRNGQDHVLSLGQVDLAQPYITGFGYAYPDGYWMQPSVASHSIKQVEHDLYRHPSSTTGTYHRQYDVYSLGILLLEIGLWTRLQTIRESLDANKDFLKELKENHVPRLAYKCGKIFEGVVTHCLEAAERVIEEDGDDRFWEWEERKKKEQACFYWEVTKELEQCCA